VHDRTPRNAREYRPGIITDCRTPFGLRDTWKTGSGLDGKARQRQHDARKHIDDDLLADARDLAIPRSLAKNEIPAKQTSKEAVIRA